MALVEVVTIFFGLAQVISPQTMTEIEDAATGKLSSISVWILFQALLAVLEMPIYLFTVVFFLIWLHRAYGNLFQLKATNITYSTTWAVGYWFLPIVNLFRPFQVVREIWRESNPDIDPYLRILPNNSNTQTFLSAWWAFWILSNVATNISVRMFEVKDLEMQQTVGFAFMLSGALTLAAAIFAILVVRSISERQELRFQKLNQNGQFSPPLPPNFE